MYSFVASAVNTSIQIDEDKIQNQRKRQDQKKGPMLNKTRTLLDSFYARYNQLLTELLDDTAFLWL